MKCVKSLLEQLEENEKWPLRYMFKFIAPNDDATVAAIRKELPKGQLTCKLSKNGKYVALTCIAMMNSAPEIIAVNEKANAIKGVYIL